MFCIACCIPVHMVNMSLEQGIITLAAVTSCTMGQPSVARRSLHLNDFYSKALSMKSKPTQRQGQRAINKQNNNNNNKRSKAC